MPSLGEEFKISGIAESGKQSIIDKYQDGQFYVISKLDEEVAAVDIAEFIGYFQIIHYNSIMLKDRDSALFKELKETFVPKNQIKEQHWFAWDHQILGNVREDLVHQPFGELNINQFMNFCDEQ